MNNLACCYRDGYGVEQNSEKSAEWFTKAKEAGYKDSNETEDDEIPDWFRELWEDHEAGGESSDEINSKQKESDGECTDEYLTFEDIFGDDDSSSEEDKTEE